MVLMVLELDIRVYPVGIRVRFLGGNRVGEVGEAGSVEYRPSGFLHSPDASTFTTAAGDVLAYGVEHDGLDDVLDQAGQLERLTKCHREATGRRRAPRTVNTLATVGSVGTVGPRLEDKPRRGWP
jgi:hypothetical protein